MNHVLLITENLSHAMKKKSHCNKKISALSALKNLSNVLRYPWLFVVLFETENKH